MNLVEEYNRLLNSITENLHVGQDIFNIIDDTWKDYQSIMPFKEKIDSEITFLVNPVEKIFFRVNSSHFTYLPRPRLNYIDTYVLTYFEDFDIHRNDERPNHRETTIYTFDVNTNMCTSVESSVDRISELYGDAYVGNGLNLNPKSL